MKQNYLKKITAIGIILIVALSTIVLPVNAANNKDTEFSLKVRSNLNDYTDAREKLDDSGTYVYYKSSSSSSVNSVKFRVMGSNKQTYPSVNSENYTRNGYGCISVGQQRFISQYVYENNKTYAFLSTPKIASGDPSGTVYGVWSPDSVGSYPYCN